MCRRCPGLPAILLSILLVRFAAAAPATTAPANTWHIVKMDQRNYVPVADVARFYRMVRLTADTRKFRITSVNRVIEGTAGTSEVRINGVKYVTCFPLRTRGDTVYLSAMDVTKIIEPLMRPGKIKGVDPIRTIVLDAGHGGHDSGAVGRYGREKDYTLDVVLRARALLLQAGFQVKMTRARDVFIPLEERAAFANKQKGALFVSVHFNKSNSGGTGIETYALAPRGVPSMDEASLRYSDFRQNPGNARDGENIALAAAIHSNMVRYLPLPDRGIKRARFVVIKNITIPGVLIEGGFVDNPLDSRYIALPAYRQRIAQAIVEAAKAYTRTITGAAPQPSAVITVGPDPNAPAQPTPTPAPPEPLTLEQTLDEADKAQTGKTAAQPGPTAMPASTRPPYRPSGSPATDAKPAFNPGNPAFGRLPAPFDHWSFPPTPIPFTTVNPAAPADISPPAPRPDAEKPARPNRDAAPAPEEGTDEDTAKSDTAEKPSAAKDTKDDPKAKPAADESTEP
jgi:N-acetylmuramoyl-L-alanine amidase